MINSILSLLLTPALLAGTQAITINSSLKDGDKISGRVELRVTVQSAAAVTQVEFYIGGKLRGTDSSTPYSLVLDTIVEPEGALAIEIGAYTSSGENKKRVLNLIVDNGVDKGAPHHTENALKFLQVSKWDEAIAASRIALKADENYAPARLAMSRAYYGKGVLDEAQKWAEDALLVSETVEAYELLGAIHSTRSFRFMASGEDKMAAIAQISSALKAAVTNRRKAVEMQLKALGPLTDDNRFKHVDLHIRNNEFATAIRLLKAKWNEYEPDLEIGNRLLFAMIRQGEMDSAVKVVAAIQKYSAPDATTFALMAVGYAYYREFEKATESLRNATLAGEESPLLMTSSAYFAIRKGDRAAMRSQIETMLKQNLTEPEVFLYLSILQNQAGELMASRDSFERAVVGNPLLYDSFIQRSYVSLAEAMAGSDRELFLKQANAFMEVARQAKPDSAEALNGLAIILMIEDKHQEAFTMAEAAMRAGPQYPWAWFTYAAALDRIGKPIEAQNAVKTAGRLDNPILGGRGIPTPEEAWDYTVQHGRIPTVIPPR